jgi:hypothetical protein
VIMCYTLCQCCSNCNVVDGNGIMSWYALLLKLLIISM